MLSFGALFPPHAPRPCRGLRDLVPRAEELPAAISLPLVMGGRAPALSSCPLVLSAGKAAWILFAYRECSSWQGWPCCCHLWVGCRCVSSKAVEKIKSLSEQSSQAEPGSISGASVNTAAEEGRQLLNY